MLLIMKMIMMLATSDDVHDVKSRIDVTLMWIGFLVDVDVEYTIDLYFGGSALKLIWW